MEYLLKIKSQEKSFREVKIANGNTKLGKGCWTINLLPGGKNIYLTKKNLFLTNVQGTCTGVCDGCEKCCYAVHDLKMHYNTCAKAWIGNTLIMRRSLKEYFDGIRKKIIDEKNGIKVFRYHSAGEIESYDYLLEMVNLALEFKDVHFYFYTKRFDLMSLFVKEGRKLPDNLVCNLSEWKDNLKNYPELSIFNKFTWDDGDDRSLDSVVHCPSVIKKPGNTKGHMNHNVHCIQCGLCWRKNTGRRIAVYNH